METTDIEFFGWVVALAMIFIPQAPIFLIIRAWDSTLPWKRSIAFYIGLIPSNIIACFYLHYSIGVLSAIVILIFTQIMQVFGVMVFAKLLVNFFGSNAFK
jgi:hypothetical protein